MAELAILGGNPVYTGSWPTWPQWDQSEEKALIDVLHSGRWQAGGRVQSFEQAFASYQQAKHGICVTNGTASLETALRALGVGPGDEVIVPAYTFSSSGLSVLVVGATPVLVDVDQWLNIDTDILPGYITPRTKAIMPVHLGGIPANMDGVLAAAKEHNLAIIEDAAQAHGSEWRGTRVGAIGDVGSFSFQTGKVMTCGDGGILVTNDEELAHKLRLFREFGRVPHPDGFDYLVAGSNERLTEFQAAILHCQLLRLDEQIARRRQTADYLAERLEDVPGVKFHGLPEGVTRWCVYIFALWVDREAFAGCSKSLICRALNAEGIPVERGYQSLADFTVYKAAQAKGQCRIGSLAKTKQAVDSVLWLTFPAFMQGLEAVDAVVEALRKVQAYAGKLRELES